MLKLYANCPLMLTQNKDVQSGQANGSQVFLIRVNVKTGETPFILQFRNARKIWGVLCKSIDDLVVKHKSNDITPNIFEIEMHQFTFNSLLHFEYEKKEVKMQGQQFPVISNCATTRHKLQGYTASSLLIQEIGLILCYCVYALCWVCIWSTNC